MSELRGPALLVLTILVAGLSLAQAGGSAPAKEKKGPSQAEILAKYSYEQLDAASNYLLAVIESHQDAQLKKKKRKALLSCDPNKTQADMLLSGPLRSLLDEKRPSEIASYESWLAQATSPGDKWANCAETCSCAAYMAVVSEAKVPPGKEEIHTKVSDRLTAENSKQTSASTAKCAAKQKWYCGSSLKQYLRAELSGQ